MKCEYCGGNLNLEDSFCSYCGEPNPHAEQHIKDMNRYQGEFENTRESVYKTTRAYTEITVRIAIIAVLFILIVVVIVLGNSTYQITTSLARSSAERNFDNYSQILDTYLEEEDFQQFVGFVGQKKISYHDSSYERYAAVSRAGRAYVELYEYIMGIVFPPSYLTDTVENGERVASKLDSFYDSLDLENYIYYEGADEERYVTALETMEQNVENLLVSYLNVPQEDAAQMKEMTSAKRAYLIEECLNNE